MLDRTSGGGGGPHNVPSCVYQGTCNLCGVVEEEAGAAAAGLAGVAAGGVVAEYTGESGASGYHRTLSHDKDVKKRDQGNAFAKHLALFHPDAQGDITNFTIKVVSTFKKPLQRQKTEAVLIASSKADHLLNSKAEHRQPAIHRVVRTREGEDLAPPPPAGGRGRGGGRGGERGGGRGGEGRGRRRGQ